MTAELEGPVYGARSRMRAASSGTVGTRAMSLKAKTYTLKKLSKPGARNAYVTLKLKIPKKTKTGIRRALQAGKHVSVKIKVVVTDAMGNARTLTKRVKLFR